MHREERLFHILSLSLLIIFAAAHRVSMESEQPGATERRGAPMMIGSPFWLAISLVCDSCLFSDRCVSRPILSPLLGRLLSHGIRECATIHQSSPARCVLR